MAQTGKILLSQQRIKLTAQVIALIACTISAFFVLFALIGVFKDDPGLLKTLVSTKPQVIIGLPFAMLTSYCLVVFLEASSGPIEFKAIGFKFKGAAAPLVFWIFVFLAIITGISILWSGTVPIAS